MKYLFIFEIVQQEKICCCPFTTGLIITAILAALIGFVNFIGSKGLIVFCIHCLGLIPALMLIYCAIKKDKLTAKVATICHTVYLCIYLFLTIFLTIWILCIDVLSVATAAPVSEESIIKAWISSLFYAFANYVFVCFYNNYDQIMSQSEVSSRDPLNNYENFNQPVANSE
jgi:hypothetical protein